MSFNFVKKHSTVVAAIAVVVVIIGGIVARAASKKQVDTSSGNAKPTVRLLSVNDFGQNSHTISANGTVDSLQQVDLKSQSTGKITKINVAVGDRVKQGQVLATTDQGGAAAALTQARGALAQAQASYNKLLAGASSEQIDVAQKAVDSAQVALNNAQTNFEHTKDQQDTAVQNAYSTLLNTSIAAVPASGNIDSVSPTITGTYTGAAEGSYAVSLYATGGGVKFSATGLETVSGDVRTQPVALGKNGLYIQFSATPAVSDTWTIQIPNTYAAAYTSNNNAYQTALKARDSAVAGAQAQVNSAQTALQQAQAALAQAQAKARPADIEAAQALILTAQGQVQAAETAYNNTVIQAPFDGTVSALAVKFADLVAPGQKVLSLVNEGGLQVKVFVSDADLPFIQMNAMAQIGAQKATGTVTNIAPSVDAVTKTAEVDIAIADPAAAGLTVGQNVPVMISGGNSVGQDNDYLLPIQAVKLTPDGKSYVYTLDADSKAQEVEVATGKVDGEHVEVTSGLSAGEKIVSNAYDVSAGDTVEITQ